MSEIDSFYQEAAALTRHDLARQKMLLPMDTIMDLCSTYCRTPRRLADWLDKKPIIGGIQKKSPHSGTVCANFKPLELAQTLETAGASAVAVVTEPHFFEGAPKHLTGITHLVKIPVIRWDFIIDEYQLYQSKLWGADVVHLILKLLDQSELALLCSKAAELDLEVIVEIAESVDLERLAGIENIAAIMINPLSKNDNELDSLLAQAQNLSPALLNVDHILLEKIADLPLNGVAVFQKIMYAQEPGEVVRELRAVLR